MHSSSDLFSSTTDHHHPTSNSSHGELLIFIALIARRGTNWSECNSEPPFPWLELRQLFPGHRSLITCWASAKRVGWQNTGLSFDLHNDTFHRKLLKLIFSTLKLKLYCRILIRNYSDCFLISPPQLRLSGNDFLMPLRLTLWSVFWPWVRRLRRRCVALPVFYTPLKRSISGTDRDVASTLNLAVWGLAIYMAIALICPSERVWFALEFIGCNVHMDIALWPPSLAMVGRQALHEGWLQLEHAERQSKCCYTSFTLDLIYFSSSSAIHGGGERKKERALNRRGPQNILITLFWSLITTLMDNLMLIEWCLFFVKGHQMGCWMVSSYDLQDRLSTGHTEL